MIEICSKCHQDSFGCTCTQFFPNVKIGFDLSREEAQALLDYVYKEAGYISYSHFPHSEILHRTIKRLEEFLR